MPGRYYNKIALKKLSASIAANTSKEAENISDTASDSDSYDASDGDDKEYNEEDIQARILVNMPHFSLPALNKGQAKDSKLLLYPTCTSTAPLPIYVANQCSPIIEPCSTRVEAMDEWATQLQATHAHLKTSSSKMKQREKKEQAAVYDVNLFSMAEQIATQDNGFFRDSYDYHYTGGNLCVKTYSDAQSTKTLVLHASGKKLQQLNISHIKEDADELDLLISDLMDKKSSEIFELLPMQSIAVNHGNMFMARFLNEIALYQLKLSEDEDKLSCVSQYSSHDAPFISMAQCSNNPAVLSLACQDRTVRFMDVAQNKPISKLDVCLNLNVLKHSSNNWAKLCANQDNTFYYASQMVLLTLDERCANETLNPCFASSIHAQQCETFSCLARSANPNLLYVGSNHKLHCLDMRCLGKKLTDRSVVTWTHQMMYPPTFMDTYMYEGNEYIAMCSPLPNDQRVCEVKGALAQTVAEMSSPALPYAPPTLDEALADTNLRGYIHVHADLAERIKCCTTGLKFHKLNTAVDGAFAQLLTVNSIGDVFRQGFTLRDEIESEKELRTGLHTAQSVNYYAKLVGERVQPKPLYCTDVHEMPVMRKIMNSKKNVLPEEPVIIKDITIDYGFEPSENEQSDKEAEPPAEEIAKKKKYKAINRGPWQKSAYQLCKYNDVITKRLMAVWDIEEDYDTTCDVHIDMIDEKLKKANSELPDLTESWLNQLPKEPFNRTRNDEQLVAGTDLPKLYGKTEADFMEVTTQTIDLELDSKQNFSYMRRDSHTLLETGEFTAIECDWPAQPPPAKRAKTKPKYQMGF